MPRKRARSTWGANEDAGNGRRRLRYWADLHDGKGYVRHSMTIVGSRRDGDEALARLPRLPAVLRFRLHRHEVPDSAHYRPHVPLAAVLAPQKPQGPQ